MENNTEKFLDIFYHYMEIRPEEIKTGSRLIEDLELNELNIAFLLIESENIFGVEVDLELYDKIKTIQELLDILNKELENEILLD